MQTINSKSAAWDSWARDISSSNPSLSELPPIDNGKYVLCEMEYPDKIRPYLEQFLQALKNKNIQYGSKEMYEFNELASFLDKIPFKIIKEEEIKKQIFKPETSVREEKLKKIEESIEQKKRELAEYEENMDKLKKIAFEYRDSFMKGEELDKREEEIEKKEEILEQNRKRIKDEWDKVRALKRLYEKDEKPRKKPKLKERKEKPNSDEEVIRDFFDLNKINSLKL